MIKSLGRGGAETLLVETLKKHDQSKFKFHYIYFLPWKDQLVQELQHAGGIVTCLTATNNLQIICRAKDILKYCRYHNVRLIHCHLPWAGFAVRRLGDRVGIPILYTEHNKQERYHFLTRWLNRLTFNRQTAVIAVSEDVALSIKGNLKPEIPVHEVVNGVNTDEYIRDSEAGPKVRDLYEIPNDAIVIGCVAVFRAQKRLKEWMEVFRRASAQNSKLYAFVIGDGPLKADLERERRIMELEGRLFMPGMQSNVKPWYSAMDIFMMTSEFEGLPIALLEAMSMECAVVTTDAGGIKQVIRSDEDGLMVRVGEWENLSEKLTDLATNCSKRRALGLAARNRVINAYDLRQMVSETERIYEEYCTQLQSNGK
ncbi:MAG: glycosyltransferase family 4 protein [Cyclobacteriaceae bacterium]